MIEIHQIENGKDIVVATLDLADDGAVDFSGVPAQMEWLRQYTVGTPDGPVSSRAGARWLDHLPDNLRGTYCWAVREQTTVP